MANHQAYLEAPYERQAALAAAFEYWCEDNDRDPDDEESLIDFERMIDQVER